mmetsp:Transcript_8640/g.24270  ORF Transcript_8640/g.24270 Transcript_8640/m.24270 type:complete len:520 (+) Transcript_8640:163-1722(+)|eukprot:CAMPEP_0181059860 /NCGR_PEP_ID=MMETSP1070-20121207/21628_1 /TAXON_ID=265543 /ORGANISM="Minutocellus polymorphus, Strain NH13" /LENGTH=519 /DNA_ID=CAMNT_0023139607 /DNA_START=62 /DNA_END=1621 /DNA_ORIENTATION=+
MTASLDTDTDQRAGPSQKFMCSAPPRVTMTSVCLVLLGLATADRSAAFDQYHSIPAAFIGRNSSSTRGRNNANDVIRRSSRDYASARRSRDARVSSALFHSVDDSHASASPLPVGIESVKELPDDFPRREDAVEAIKAVRKACLVTMKLQPLHSPSKDKDGTILETISTLTKQQADNSPVTVGDFAAQAIVLGHLSQAFPSDRFIAEECSSHLTANPGLLEEILAASKEHISSSEQLCRYIDLGQSYNDDGTIGKGQTNRIWTCDPIDGTKGFIRGKLDGGQYAVCLSKLENGTPTIGVLGCPNLPCDVDSTDYKWAPGETDANNRKSRGCIFVASKGGGCYQLPLFPDGSIQGPLRVTPNDASSTTIADARFCCGVESGFGDYLGQQARIATIFHGPNALDVKGEIVNARRMDSQAKHGVLARGGAEIFVRLPKPGYVEWVWDHAAGFVVIEEAGGRLTSIDGQEIDFSLGAKLSPSVRGIAMTNGGIFHDRLLSAFKEQEEALLADKEEDGVEGVAL